MGAGGGFAPLPDIVKKCPECHLGFHFDSVSNKANAEVAKNDRLVE